MKLEFSIGPDGNQRATVTLSRRNLLAGLHKLDMPNSARTIISGDDRLILKFEDNDEHYGDRRPGVMYPDTEEFITWEQYGSS